MMSSVNVDVAKSVDENPRFACGNGRAGVMIGVIGGERRGKWLWHNLCSQ
jgi:hypothetical protein